MVRMAWWRVSLGLAGALVLLATVPLSAAASVADLVAQVSQTELMAHVTGLEGDRSTPAGQAAAAAYITAELESYGYTVMSQSVSGSENLWVTIPGTTHANEVFVLGAHFDAVSGSPGADDDASGVAAVLEAARVMAGTPLDRTIHLVLFALEESGYQGSEAFAGALALAGTNVVGMISLDMIGYTCSTPGCQIVLPDIPDCVESNLASDVGDFIGVGANTASTFMLNGFLASSSIHQPALPIESFIIEGNGTCFPDSRRSDHKSFWDEGYPAIILGDGAESRNPNYHLSTDTAATLDPVFLTAVSRAVLAYVATTAGAPSVPLLTAPGVAALSGALLGLGVWARRLRGRSPAGRRPVR